jgi:hypothetical protein
MTPSRAQRVRRRRTSRRSNPPAYGDGALRLTSPAAACQTDCCGAEEGPARTIAGETRHVKDGKHGLAQ